MRHENTQDIRVLGRQKHHCKGPEAGASLVCWKNSKRLECLKPREGGRENLEMKSEKKDDFNGHMK